MNIEQMLQQATERHRAGDLVEARRLYAMALKQSPEDAVALIRSGLLEFQDGHAQEALAFIHRAIAAAPLEARYPFVLGEVLASMLRWEDAAAAYRQSLALQAAAADVHFSLGRALQSCGRWSEAAAAYQAAAQIEPDSPDALNNLGNCLQRLDDLAGAEAAYRRSLELRPADASAMSNLGTAMTAMGRTDDALKMLRAAAALEPDVVRHAVNLGAALCQQRDFAQAQAVLSRALARDPDNADAAYNLANATAGLGQLSQAVEQYRRAISLRPNDAAALNNLGTVYKELGEFKLSAQAFEAAIAAQPASVVAINNLGCLLRSVGKMEEAERTLRRGLEIAPRHPALHNNLGNVLKDAGELDEAIDCFREAVALNSTDSEAHSNLAYALSFRELDGKRILEECRRWNERHASVFAPGIRPSQVDRLSDRRLRIGYVSPDFRDHCQSLFTIPLLAHHDHGGFEIFCYSNVERPDAHTARIGALADRWRDVRRLDDEAICDMIRADAIDILVDLTMHMAHGRPLVFARRPVPIQVAWLAYPGTTGLSAMDYRLSDPRLDPPGFDNQYSERTVRLPDSFWCYDPLADQPEVNALPALSRGYLTLGCLNNPCKLTDATLRLWRGVMTALPDARLLLMAPPGSYRDRLLSRLAKQDIASHRIEFVAHQPREHYLRTYHQIDLQLDTFPYNGHTTSLDSLWMGVPVITRVGPTCVGRAGLSQLFHLDLLELACESDQAFIDAAVALGSDLPRLIDLRRELRPRLERSPLMDGARFARNMEMIYRQMFRDYCAT
jgi:protein O-GlcNAc transferase